MDDNGELHEVKMVAWHLKRSVAEYLINGIRRYFEGNKFFDDLSSLLKEACDHSEGDGIKLYFWDGVASIAVSLEFVFRRMDSLGSEVVQQCSHRIERQSRRAWKAFESQKVNSINNNLHDLFSSLYECLVFCDLWECGYKGRFISESRGKSPDIEIAEGRILVECKCSRFMIKENQSMMDTAGNIYDIMKRSYLQVAEYEGKCKDSNPILIVDLPDGFSELLKNASRQEMLEFQDRLRSWTLLGRHTIFTVSHLAKTSHNMYSRSNVRMGLHWWLVDHTQMPIHIAYLLQRLKSLGRMEEHSPQESNS